MPSAKATSNEHELTDAELDAMIEQDPSKPGRHHARFVEYGTHIWAIIAALQGSDWDNSQVAADFHVPETAIHAAIRYYDKHRELIDAELLLQHEAHVSG